MKKLNTLCFFLALGLCAVQHSFAADAEEGFKPMFNGKDLTGWAGHPDLWSATDGTIQGQTTPEHPAKENTFLIWTNGQPADFELRYSYKILPNNDVGFANSGIQYRSRVVKPDGRFYRPYPVSVGPDGSIFMTNGFGYWVISGYQADFEAGQTYSGILYEEKARGILAQRGQKVVIHSNGEKEVVGSFGTSAEIQAAIKKEDWNDYVVIAKGNHLQHFINGKPTIDVVDEQVERAAKSGVIALQLHAGPSMTVQFRNLRIKELK